MSKVPKMPKIKADQNSNAESPYFKVLYSQPSRFQNTKFRNIGIEGILSIKFSNILIPQFPIPSINTY